VLARGPFATKRLHAIGLDCRALAARARARYPVMTMIPVVDLFAGPGGLGEGFSCSTDSRGRRQFQLAISIEKDPLAHATLRLRAFWRAFAGRPPSLYERYLRGEIDWGGLAARFPEQAARAASEAQCIELGPSTVHAVRKEIRRVLPSVGPWALIGGPPCQAYSLAGRARNKGVVGYDAGLDHRQTLYVEYLQILADHGPPIFVMENVKGLLSAQLENQWMFQRIREDLADPHKALRRENRSSVGGRPRYSIRAIVQSSSLFAQEPSDFLVKTEEFGIPQRRHRVILVGVREDGPSRLECLIPSENQETVKEALHGLPRLRSGLSKEVDSNRAWFNHMRAMHSRAWLRKVEPEVRARIEWTADHVTEPLQSRGRTYLDVGGNVYLNHATRSHILPDLERYMFASAYAAVHGVSPVLSKFPQALLPAHLNVDRALNGGLFSDRFRVQLADAPSTTITSHISKDGHYYIHYDSRQCRSLTVREAARLQTFSDDYFFCGPRTSQYHQVGNAVPPRLATQIADSVAKLLGA
jgi:DNA (cytosine-5)-methyltransferase 1